MPIDVADLEKHMSKDSRCAVLLGNLNRCISEGLVRTEAHADFFLHLGKECESWLGKHGADLPVLILRGLAVRALECVHAPIDTENLFAAFQTTYTGIYGHRPYFGRVVTQISLRANYTAAPQETDSFGNPVSIDPSDGLLSDLEFGQPLRTPDPCSFDLLPTFRLCGKDRLAFIADLSRWDSVTEDVGYGPADRAAAYLGLPYADGEPLVMLRVSRDAITDWSAIRRPTLFDAVDHWWWICWPGDPFDRGHTLDLAGLLDSPARLMKGGVEWVIDDQMIDSTDGKVVAVDLGATQRTTIAGDHAEGWTAYHRLFVDATRGPPPS